MIDVRSLLRKLVGVNWKTTLAGAGALITAAGKIYFAFKTKDFATVFTSANELVPDITLILLGVGLLNAKDNDTAGAGEKARKVE